MIPTPQNRPALVGRFWEFSQGYDMALDTDDIYALDRDNLDGEDQEIAELLEELDL